MCIDHHIILFDKRKKSATNTLLPQPRKRITITTNIERVSHLIIESQRTKYNLTLDMNIEPSILDTKRIPRKKKKKNTKHATMFGVFFILIPLFSILYFYKKLKLIGLQLESNTNFFWKKTKIWIVHPQ